MSSNLNLPFCGCLSLLSLPSLSRGGRRGPVDRWDWLLCWFMAEPKIVCSGQPRDRHLSLRCCSSGGGGLNDPVAERLNQ